MTPAEARDEAITGLAMLIASGVKEQSTAEIRPHAEKVVDLILAAARPEPADYAKAVAQLLRRRPEVT